MLGGAELCRFGVLEHSFRGGLLACHAEVQEERGPRVEVHPELLAAALGDDDAAPHQRCLQLPGGHIVDDLCEPAWGRGAGGARRAAVGGRRPAQPIAPIDASTLPFIIAGRATSYCSVLTLVVCCNALDDRFADRSPTHQ